MTIKTFWDEAHKTNNTRWLTGTSLDCYLAKFRLPPPKGKKVLEVGVGLGYVVKDLAKICEAHVLDTSEIALNKVKKIATTYNISTIETLPKDYFDLVFSHLVVQHLDGEKLDFHLKHCIKSLNSTGLFCMQYSEGIDVPIDDSEYMQQIGEVVYDPEDMDKRIYSNGGYIYKELGPAEYPCVEHKGAFMIWHRLQIKKQ